MILWKYKQLIGNYCVMIGLNFNTIPFLGEIKLVDSLFKSRGISVCSHGKTSNFDNTLDKANFISDSANRFPIQHNIKIVNSFNQ